MADSESPLGRRFSQAYVTRGEPSDDSKRMRARIAALIRAIRRPLEELGTNVEREQGVTPPHEYGGRDWEQFLNEAALRDVLDLVTTAFGTIVQYDRDSDTYARDRGQGKTWVAGIQRIFAEENVRYRVDDLGGVHFSIDDEFESNSAATIKALSGLRYAATLENFNGALKALSATPPATKNAIRAVFAANEGLFRLMFPKAPRLTADEIDQHLASAVQKAIAGDAAAAGATSKLLRSFKEWVDGAHFYRHEPGHAEPKAPSVEIAVLMTSAGAAWLRWLAEIDGMRT